MNFVHHYLCTTTAGGTCLEDIELLRNDEAWLDALGAVTIPDPRQLPEIFSAGSVRVRSSI